MVVSKDIERITISIDKEVKEKLDQYAELYGISTSKLARNLVYVGLDQANFLHKVGVNHLVKGLDTFKDLFKRLIDSETNKDSSGKNK